MSNQELRSLRRRPLMEMESTHARRLVGNHHLSSGRRRAPVYWSLDRRYWDRSRFLLEFAAWKLPVGSSLGTPYGLLRGPS
jgi:hypothetical protein